MATCPNCKAEVSNPDKVLKNVAFTIEAYTCPKCQTCFKVTRWQTYIAH